MNDRRADDDVFAAQVGAALDRVPVDAAIRSRLATARRRAVASIDAPIPRAPARWIPVGALATTLLTVGIGVAVQRPVPPVYDEQQLATVEDMDLLIDLEFAAWLDTDNVNAG